jgi:hypothetical protein
MSARFTMSFDMENDAFHDPDGSYGDEVARILRDVAAKVSTQSGGKIRDVNGNTVGKWAVR